MKRKTLLVISGILALGALGCQKDPLVGPAPAASEDETLAGETVTVGEDVPPVKLFVLNEGGLGSNEASLDFFRFPDGKYVRDAYGKMNPEIPFSLGDVGNDIAVHDGKVWIVVNNSGLIEVVDAYNEKHLATVKVMTPRNIAFDDRYAYVTSYAGSFVHYNADYSVGDHMLRDGRLYKIDCNTMEKVDSLDLGREPEGIAIYGDKAYVALSGGLSQAITYQYENRIQVIDLKRFAVSGDIEVAPNLKSVFSDGKGWIYATNFGIYHQAHSGLYAFPADGSSPAVQIAVPGTVGCVSCAAICGDTVWAIGTDDEWDWTPGKEKTYYLFSTCLSDGSKAGKRITAFTHAGKNPYGLYALSDGKDLRSLFVGDAPDWNNPGTVYCYGKDFRLSWKATAGIGPAHFAVYNGR